MDVETQAWEEPPGSSSPNSNIIGNHGADVQLAPPMKVSILAATDLPFPLNTHNLCNRRPKASKMTSHRKESRREALPAARSPSLARDFCLENAQKFLSS